MPTKITNYQCPACTGPLRFDANGGKLECEYCGTRYDLTEIEALYEEKNNAAQQAYAGQETAETERQEEKAPAGDWEEELKHLKSYNCPSCGAELVCDETTAATSCPYCGNPSIIPGQFANMLRPDYVIPFKLEKNSAIEALKKYYKGKAFLPKAFAEHNHIEEIKGVYVPFWLIDGEADADIRFHATRIHSHERGKERITVTEHYQVRRAGTVHFSRIPVDASSKMPDEHMDSIEPFNYDELTDFSMSYLPGYLADKYDVSVDECTDRLKERAENTAEALMQESVTGYTTCIPETKNITVQRGKIKYALLPVWMLSTQWKDQNFLFAMNGQTGKLIGDLPVSMTKFWLWFAGIAAPISALVYLFLS